MNDASLTGSRRSAPRRLKLPSPHRVRSATAVRRHAGLPPIRCFLLRNPVDRLDPQALFCTDPAREPLQILTSNVRRWQVEVTFREVRATTSGSRPSASGRTALHAVSARAVLAGRPARRSSPPQARQASRPPPRIASDSRRRPPPVLAAEGFLHILPHRGGAKISTGTPRSHCLRPLPCRIARANWPKSRLGADSFGWTPSAT